MKQQKSDLAFNLVIDEERCEALQVMVTCFMRNIPSFVLSHPDRAGIVLPALKDMIHDIANKQHELGWCKDDDCQWSGHNHE